MDNSAANKGKIFTFKHYILLLIWWLSLGFTLDTNSAILGLVLSFLFFLLTAMKVIQKSILIMLAVFVLTAIFPPLGLVVGILALVFFLLRITFVIDNWRALAVGMYAYGIYLMVVIFNTFFYETIVVQATLRIVDFFNAGGETAVETFGQHGVEAVNATTAFIKDALHVGSYVFPLFLAIGFHKMLSWLYKHGYTTDRAFHVIGLTPLVILALMLPFLKIDLGGDAIFTGSLADGVDGTPGVDGVDTTISLPNAPLPEPVTTLIDTAGVDVVGWFTDSAAGFSPAIESSVATMAVRGIYTVDGSGAKQSAFTTRFKDHFQSVRTDRENHTIITDEKGHPIAEITHDALHDTDRTVLNDGRQYVLHNQTGNITDIKGKMLARIREIPGGGKILVTNDDRVIRTYGQDGTVKDGNGAVVGEIQLSF